MYICARRDSGKRYCMLEYDLQFHWMLRCRVGCSAHTNYHVTCTISHVTYSTDTDFGLPQVFHWTRRCSIGCNAHKIPMLLKALIRILDYRRSFIGHTDVA